MASRSNNEVVNILESLRVRAKDLAWALVSGAALALVRISRCTALALRSAQAWPSPLVSRWELQLVLVLDPLARNIFHRC